MSDNSADLVIHNAKVITLDQNVQTAEMIAIKGNLILAVGAKDDVDRFTDPNTKMLDCEGRTVIPGFNDAHCHPIPLAITMRYVDCSPSMVKSIVEIQDRLRQHSEGISASRWIRAAKYNETQLVEKRTLPEETWMKFHRTIRSCWFMNPENYARSTVWR